MDYLEVNYRCDKAVESDDPRIHIYSDNPEFQVEPAYISEVAVQYNRISTRLIFKHILQSIGKSLDDVVSYHLNPNNHTINVWFRA